MTYNHKERVMQALCGFYKKQLPRPKRKRGESGIPTESQEQKTLVRWLDKRNIDYCHVPNQSYGSELQAIIHGRHLRALGRKSGVPDILIFSLVPSPHYAGVRGVAVEMKRIKGSVTSEDQKLWEKILTKNGWLVFNCKGADEAIMNLESLGY
jgi:hypothetical protein